ncbi:hypothetical protein [Richelia sinica]|uniref:hypothetical protein n=1 Tax=Richelia sinica TaxID=1357545 RepID=UPI0016867526|nr:hypothetical protein [Richelia sinica]MBD2664180.1 hypothetical protein [Richelia sinica FACHB-800]
MDANELFSFLIFLKRLDEDENLKESQPKGRKTEYQPKIFLEMPWKHERKTGSISLPQRQQFVTDDR